MRYLFFRVVLFSLGIVPPSASGSGFDIYTLNCLLGVENDPNPQFCAVLDRELGAKAEEAHQVWLRRNATVLNDMHAACQERISRAYAGNDAEIRAAKARAKRYQEDRLEAYKKNPKPNSIDCRAYINDFTNGSGEVDKLRQYVSEIRNTKADAIDWSLPFFAHGDNGF